jgi:hypothetical protein
MWYQSADIKYYMKATENPFYDNYYDTTDADIISFKLPDSKEWSAFAFDYGSKIFFRYRSNALKVQIEIFSSTIELVKQVVEESYLRYGIEEKYILEAVKRGEHTFQSYCSIWICNKVYFGQGNPPSYTYEFEAPKNIEFELTFDKPENEIIFAFI